MATNEALTDAIAAIVRTKLDARGHNQSFTAAATGIPRVTLIRRLNGQTPFTTTELLAVASVLNTTPSDILREAEASA
jgi:transcriptional regulator with XRE-family HTH domain